MNLRAVDAAICANINEAMEADDMDAVQAVISLTRATVHICDAADVKNHGAFLKLFGPQCDAGLVKRVAPAIAMPSIKKSAALKSNYDDMMQKLA
eukprot:1459870-Pyramimonas_sp.AAC.1